VQLVAEPEQVLQLLSHFKQKKEDRSEKKVSGQEL
jgi:hypothetical protein